VFLFGTRDGTRTRIALRPADFKSAVYTIPPLWRVFVNRLGRLLCELVYLRVLAEQNVWRPFAESLITLHQDAQRHSFDLVLVSLL